VWFRTNEKDAVARMAEGFKISPDDALGIYKATLKSYTLDGTISRELHEKIVTFQRKQLKVEKEVPPETVYDFTILRALNEERKNRDHENETSLFACCLLVIPGGKRLQPRSCAETGKARHRLSCSGGLAGSDRRHA
jgi:hypothetical protein